MASALDEGLLGDGGGDGGLLGGHVGDVELGLLGLVGGGDGELGLDRGGSGGLLGGDGRLGSTAGAGADELLDLGGVVAGVLLAEGGGVAGVLLGNGAGLGGLGVDDVGGVLEVLVDELLVGDVDEGQGEGEGGANQGETPVRDQLGKVVADEGSNGGLRGSVSMDLGKYMVVMQSCPGQRRYSRR